MKRCCLLCGVERHDTASGAGDYCRPCRLAIRIEDMLDANWRLRAVNWFRHGCGHRGWQIRSVQS